MALHSRKNEYQGVNAHLQSFFQSEGDWASFHNKHISDLAEAISAVLPAGYVVDMTKSLQISEYHPDTGEKIKRPLPDVTIYQYELQGAFSATAPAMPATLAVPIEETLENEETDLFALSIYQLKRDAVLGQPVVQVEILSPTNKPPGEGYVQYVNKRAIALKSGLVMVEVDYLHESASPLRNVPIYRHHPNSFPYMIAVSDPRPNLKEGRTLIYGFAVDDPIPVISIPLVGTDRVEVDFGKVYHRTFESLPVYSLRVDYEQLPRNFDAYTEADQTRIRQVMERISAKT